MASGFVEYATGCVLSPWLNGPLSRVGVMGESLPELVVQIPSVERSTGYLLVTLRSLWERTSAAEKARFRVVVFNADVPAGADSWVSGVGGDRLDLIGRIVSSLCGIKKGEDLWHASDGVVPRGFGGLSDGVDRRRLWADLTIELRFVAGVRRLPFTALGAANGCER